MRTRVYALACGLACALAPARGLAQAENEAPSVRVEPAPRPTGTSTDFAAYPPLRPASRPRPAFEVHGLVHLWWTPIADEGAPRHDTPFRLRHGILRLDAHPTQDVHLIARLSAVHDVPLIDAAVSWTGAPHVDVTLGQFRLPLGAAATTPGGQFVMLDRPGFVDAMTKGGSFRDVGVMIGSDEEGLFGRLLHFRLALAAGNGRLFDGDPLDVHDARDLLWVARAIVDVGPRLAEGTRLALGGQLAWTRDPALDTRDLAAARARASSLLGRSWTPLDRERETMLAGADLTLSTAGVWAQAEWLLLESRPTDGSASRRATGASLELAYTLPWRLDDTSFQLASRGEYVDPDLDRASDERWITSGGLNVQPAQGVRFSIFGTLAVDHDPSNGASRTAGELSLRALFSF
jgi:hypothetical protein